ncbi:GumC family protein [Andreprevotia chitinilytica]|uniref:GumC family protein n=1 Tax=Andreprevotia chitinilytica TaxID=396808 RepID=UPI00068F8818|nr:Wzz/FepE/Etk N-terminal domain-containing protein [Andreprevotia chitinilytica]
MENQVIPSPAEQEVSLLDLLIVLVKYRKLLIGLPAIAGVAALVYSLLATPVFEAKTSILPPQQQQSSAAAMLSQLGGLAGAAGGALGVKSPNDLYIAMMQSRNLETQLVERFKLREAYESKSLEGTLKQLEGNSKIASSKDGLITISVEDTSAKRAAELANAYVDGLRQLTKELAIGEAALRRQFFEGQLQKAKKELADAEVALKQVQEKTGLLQLEAQGRATIEALASLRAQMAAKQVQLGAMRHAMTNDNPEYQRTRAELGGLQQQLAELTKGGSDDDVVLSRSQVPEAGLAYIRKMRDVKYYETLFELVSKQYELAKLDEARDGANIQVLDPAVEPEYKVKPRRSLLIVLALVGGFFLALLVSFVREALLQMCRNSEQQARLEKLRSIWKGRLA